MAKDAQDSPAGVVIASGGERRCGQDRHDLTEEKDAVLGLDQTKPVLHVAARDELQVVRSRAPSRRRSYKAFALLDLAARRSTSARMARERSVCAASVLRVHATADGPRSATSAGLVTPAGRTARSAFLYRTCRLVSSAVSLRA